MLPIILGLVGSYLIVDSQKDKLKFEDGGSTDEKLYKVVGKKDKQLVEISELPMTKEDCKKFIQIQGIEKTYQDVDIVPYHGSKPRFKYEDGGEMANFQVGQSVIIKEPKNRSVRELNAFNVNFGDWKNKELVITDKLGKDLYRTETKERGFPLPYLLSSDEIEKYADGGTIELYYVQDANGNVKNISKSYEDADRFWEKSLKFNGDIRIAIVPKEDWEKEKVSSSNIKRYSDGGTMAKGGKIKVGDLVRVKKYGWVMVVDKIDDKMFFLENDKRGTMNGNAGSYLISDIEPIMADGGELANFRFKKGDIVYAFQYASDKNGKLGKNIDTKYVVGNEKDGNLQKWAKVEIVEQWNDEKYWETYKAKLIDGHYERDGKIKKGEVFVVSQGQLSKSNKRPISMDYMEEIIKAEKEDGYMAKGGMIENYKQRLENMSDSELAEEYEYETGVSKDDIMSDIDDERDTYIDELVFRLKQTMRSRGEYADGGTMAKGGEMKDRSEKDSIKLSKEYQKVLDSNFDDKVYKKYEKIVKETQIPKEELQKIEHYVITTPKGERRDIDIYRYW